MATKWRRVFVVATNHKNARLLAEEGFGYPSLAAMRRERPNAAPIAPGYQVYTVKLPAK